MTSYEYWTRRRGEVLGTYSESRLEPGEKHAGLVVVLGYFGGEYRLPAGMQGNEAFAFLWRSPAAHYVVGPDMAITCKASDRSRVTLPGFPGAAAIPGLQFSPCLTGGLLVQVAPPDVEKELSVLDLLTRALPLVLALIHREGFDPYKRVLLCSWGQRWQVGETDCQLLVPLPSALLLAAPMVPTACAAFDSFRALHPGRFLLGSKDLAYLSALILDRAHAPQCKKALDLAMDLL
jgi:hypothetical protein